MILVLGGCGFIGSHVVEELLSRNYEVVVYDNFSNSSPNVLNRFKKEVIVSNSLEQAFEHTIECVIHLAGYKSVRESIEQPLKYYRNNFCETVHLLELMEQHNVKNLIFSSSATVYGTATPPYDEDFQTGVGITNAYGRTKYFIEEMLKDLDNSWNITMLRYFNPIGKHEQPTRIAENMMPILLKCFRENKTFTIYGGDYDTPDGTPIRDFIHVEDLARAHVLALEKMDGLKIYNLGTGTGVSVLELIQTFNRANSVEVSYVIGERRSGDLSISIADVKRAKEELNWECLKSIEDMCRDAFLY